jgi:ribose-phosphate pyrophosphokinase
MDKESLLFIGPGSEGFEQIGSLLEINQGSYSIHRLANKERYLLLENNVEGKNCLVIGSISPPEEQLFLLLMLCHTLKKEKAQKVSLFVPYLGYCRQEKNEDKKSQMMALIATLISASGVDEIMTLDLHSDSIQNLFAIPLHSLSPVSLFAEKIKEIGFTEATIVAPDKGAQNRATMLAKELGQLSSPLFMEKKRTARSVSHEKINQPIQERVIVVDDIIDSANTLLSCCKELKKAGAKEIIIFVTHALFTKNKWKKLLDLNVKKIYCCHTVNPKPLGQEQVSLIPFMNHASNWIKSHF